MDLWLSTPDKYSLSWRNWGIFLKGHFASLAVQLGLEPQMERLRVQRRTRLMQRVGLVFVHVPRTAGSSISHLIYGTFIGHFSIAALQAVGGAPLLALPRLAIARNPFDRLASAFHFARRGFGGGLHPARAAPHVRREIARIDGFERFVKEWLPARDPARLDGVFRPQVDYLCDATGAIPIDHLGRFEELARTEHWISERLGRRIILPSANDGDHASASQPYDAEMRAIVSRIYAEDFATLGY